MTVKTTVYRVEDITRETITFELFRPFTIENAYVFRSDNIRELFERIRKDEQALLTWNPEKVDWYDYWINSHLPGLKKWVFPTLEEDMRAQPKRVYTYRDLIELFETSTNVITPVAIGSSGRPQRAFHLCRRSISLRPCAAAFRASEELTGRA